MLHNIYLSCISVFMHDLAYSDILLFSTGPVPVLIRNDWALASLSGSKSGGQARGQYPAVRGEVGEQNGKKWGNIQENLQSLLITYTMFEVCYY